MDAFGQTLTKHDSVLVQHEQTLQHVFVRLDEIAASVKDIQDQLTQAAAHATAQATVQAPAAAPGVPIAREIPVPAPERYSGDLGVCQAFLMQCSLVFEQLPRTYATDRSRICYLLGLLKGSALTWGSAVWEEQSPVCNSYAAFTSEMRKVFDHPVRGKEATRRLMSLHQGSRSVAEFAVEFRTLAAESGWNNEALQGAFQRALNEDIKDELASRDESRDLDELISCSIRLDNRLRERRRERGFRSQRGGSSSSSNIPFHARSPTNPFHASTNPFHASLPSGVPSPKSPEPRRESPSPNEDQSESMELGRLSMEERSRRLQSRSCLYCGQPGHFKATCPVRPVKDGARQ